MATPKIRTLAKALEILGGEKALADALEVNTQQLARWLDGSSDTPDSKYLAALEIVARGPFNGRRQS